MIHKKNIDTEKNHNNPVHDTVTLFLGDVLSMEMAKMRCFVIHPNTHTRVCVCLCVYINI